MRGIMRQKPTTTSLFLAPTIPNQTSGSAFLWLLFLEEPVDRCKTCPFGGYSISTWGGEEKDWYRSRNSTLNKVSKGPAFQVWHSFCGELERLAVRLKAAQFRLIPRLLFQMEMFIFCTPHLNFMQKLYQAQALQILSLNAIHYQFSPSVLLSWCHLQGEKHSGACSFLWCKPHLFAGSPALGIILKLGRWNLSCLVTPPFFQSPTGDLIVLPIKYPEFVKKDSGKLRRNAEWLQESNSICKLLNRPQGLFILYKFYANISVVISSAMKLYWLQKDSGA